LNVERGFATPCVGPRRFPSGKPQQFFGNSPAEPLDRDRVILDDLRETTSSGRTPRRNHVQRPFLDVSARSGRCPYRMEKGAIQIDSVETIGLPDITPELARESGFLGVLDLLKIAKHGRGQNIYLIRFHYVARAKRKGRRKLAST
jgi:hypothetical protein